MASRKEERERLRQAREEAEASERRQQRKRLIAGYVVAGVITAAVVAGVVIAVSGGGEGGGSGAEGERLNEAFGVVPEGVAVDDREGAEAPSDGQTADLEEAAEAAGCELMLDQRDEGNTHVPPDSEVPDYRANPPTSGDHAPEPLADGAFSETPSPFNFIHALEHGRIQIQYSPELPEEAQRELLGLYDEDPAGMIVFPNDEQPFLVAATAWQQTMGCDSYESAATLDAIRAFRNEFRGRGPEPIALQ